MSNPNEKQRPSPIPNLMSPAEAPATVEYTREKLSKLEGSKAIPNSTEIVVGPKGPSPLLLSDIQADEAPDKPPIEALAANINFLASVALAFKNRDDFFERLYDYVSRYRPLHKSIKDAKKELYTQLYIFKEKNIDGLDKRTFESMAKDRVMAACPSSASEQEAMALLIETISSLESFLRPFLLELPVQGAYPDTRFSEILKRYPLFHLSHRIPKGSLLAFNQSLWLHFSVKSNDKSMCSPKDFIAPSGELPDCLAKSKLPLSFVTDHTSSDFPKGALVDDVLEKCILNGQGADPLLPTHDSPNLNSQEKSRIDLGTIRKAMETKASQCCEAIQSLIALVCHPDFECPPSFQGLIEDLVPKPIPHFPGSFSDLLAFFSLIQSHVESTQELDWFAAQLELNFLKSYRLNGEVWETIGYSAKNLSNPVALKLLQGLKDSPFTPSKDIHAIPSPKPEDVEILARATLLLEPGDLPIGFVQKVLDQFPTQLDLHKAELFMQDQLGLLEGQAVLSKSIRNHLSLVLPDKGNLGPLADRIVKDTLAYIQKKPIPIQDYVRNHQMVQTLSHYGLSSQPLENFEADHPKILEYMMGLSPDLFREEAPHALPDDEFGRIYTSSIRCNPSLNFDTAQLGIINQNLVVAADKWTSWVHSTKPDPFSYIFDYSSSRILNSLFPGGLPECYLPRNLIFSKSGSHGFDLISPLILSKEGDRILASSEEYGSFLELQNNRETPCTLLDAIDGRSNDEIYAELIDKLRADENIRFMLVSDVTRRGTQMPLEVFAKARNTLIEKYRRSVFLIVDGCQSFGRKPIDLQRIQPEAFFTSGIKAADAGEGGYVLFSDSAIGFRGRRVSKCGWQSEQTMARLLLASDPMALGYRDILDPSQRDAALQDLSLKFATLADKLLAGKGFDFLRPSQSHRESDRSPKKSELRGLFECRIKGYSRDTVSKVAKRFGLHIASFYEDPIDPANSFRIAFHPHMGNRSVLLLAYVLHLLTEMKRLNLPAEDCHSLLMKRMS